MSLEIHVCWRGEFSPSRAELQKTLESAGFEAEVLHDFVGSYGYWPIDLSGLKTGVEVYFDHNVPNLREIYPVLAGAVGDRDKAVTFTFGGDPAECGVAFALAAAIAQMTDAVIYDPQSAEVVSTVDAISTAKLFFKDPREQGYRAREDEEQN